MSRDSLLQHHTRQTRLLVGAIRAACSPPSSSASNTTESSALLHNPIPPLSDCMVALLGACGGPLCVNQRCAHRLLVSRIKGRSNVNVEIMEFGITATRARPVVPDVECKHLRTVVFEGFLPGRCTAVSAPFIHPKTHDRAIAFLFAEEHAIMVVDIATIWNSRRPSSSDASSVEEEVAPEDGAVLGFHSLLLHGGCPFAMSGIGPSIAAFVHPATNNMSLALVGTRSRNLVVVDLVTTDYAQGFHSGPAMTHLLPVPLKRTTEGAKSHLDRFASVGVFSTPTLLLADSLWIWPSTSSYYHNSPPARLDLSRKFPASLLDLKLPRESLALQSLPVDWNLSDSSEACGTVAAVASVGKSRVDFLVGSGSVMPSVKHFPSGLGADPSNTSWTTIAVVDEEKKDGRLVGFQHFCTKGRTVEARFATSTQESEKEGRKVVCTGGESVLSIHVV